MAKKSILEEAIIIDSGSSPVKYKKEKWKKIKISNITYPFEISTHGNVRNSETHEILKPFSRNGYLAVTIYTKSKITKNKRLNQRTVSIHKLVAMMFIPIPKRYVDKGLGYKSLVPDHINNIRIDNHVENLQWLTPQENTQVAYEHGYIVNGVGEHCHLSKMTKETAIKCCEMISEGKNNRYISKELNISLRSIQHIRERVTWREVSKNYVFPKLGDSIPYSVDESTIHEICKLLEMKKYSDSAIAKILFVKREYVRDIRLKKRRKDISKNYNF